MPKLAELLKKVHLAFDEPLAEQGFRRIKRDYCKFDFVNQFFLGVGIRPMFSGTMFELSLSIRPFYRGKFYRTAQGPYCFEDIGTRLDKEIKGMQSMEMTLDDYIPLNLMAYQRIMRPIIEKIHTVEDCYEQTVEIESMVSQGRWPINWYGRLYDLMYFKQYEELICCIEETNKDTIFSLESYERNSKEAVDKGYITFETFSQGMQDLKERYGKEIEYNERILTAVRNHDEAFLSQIIQENICTAERLCREWSEGKSTDPPIPFR